VSDSHGRIRTKACCTCKIEKPLDEFHADLARCKDCRKLSDAIAHRRYDAVMRLAHRIEGSQRKYRSLPVSERDMVRQKAAELHELGADMVLATKAQATEKRGFVYVITNPAWPGYVKIGRAFDPEARLSGYQTSCPKRDYALYAAIYFEDCHFAETEIHARLYGYRQEGEWFYLTPFLARHAINKLRSLI